MDSAAGTGNTSTISEISFGAWLRQKRKALDMTQDDLAECAGCSPATVQMIEHGQRRPSRQIADLLAGCLRIPDNERAEFLARARGTSVEQDEGQSAVTPVQPAQAPGNLPVQLTALIGRDEDLAALKNLLLRDDVRLVTLAGPPGIGKTRIALQVGADLSGGEFQDHVYLVDLVSITDPTLVIPAIARVLDVQDMGAQSMLDVLTQSLKRKRMLLVLDNFEQVIHAAPSIADLLSACPNIKALITSREALNVRGERVFNVSPLPLPDLSDLSSTAALSQNPAIALFVQRAQEVDHRFELTGENAAAVASICARLDGVPLAIELVAARTKMLPLKALLARLQAAHDQGPSHLSVLSGGARDLPERHRTLRNAIGWSYSLLSETEKILFRRLGVFLGGISLAAAEAVCNARSRPDLDIFEGISLLLNKNLLKREAPRADEVEGEPQYKMLETIREYALERLGESEEADELRVLHAEYYLAMASAMDSVFVGESQRQLLNRLERDYDNLRAALAWTIDNKHIEIAAQLGNALARFWELRGYLGEGKDWLLRILAQIDDRAPSTLITRARLLRNAGRLNYYLTDYAAATALLEESLELSKEAGFKVGVSSAYMNLGNVAWFQGDYAMARHYYQECLQINQELGNRTNVANSFWMLGNVAGESGDFERAESLLNQGLALGRETGDIFVTFGSLRELAMTLIYQHRFNEALPLAEECLELALYATFRVGVSWANAVLGFALIGTGDYRRAESLFLESLTLARELDKVRMADTLEGLAEAELKLLGTEGRESKESRRRVAVLLGSAENTRRALNISLIPARREDQQRLLAEARRHLGDSEYNQGFSAGLAMSVEDAISYALNL